MLAYSIRIKPVITPLASRCISRSPTGITLITLNLILPRTILRLTNRKVWRGCTLTPGSCRPRISSDTGATVAPGVSALRAAIPAADALRAGTTGGAGRGAPWPVLTIPVVIDPGAGAAGGGGRGPPRPTPAA